MEEEIITQKNEITESDATPPMKYGYVTVEHATYEFFEDIWRYFGYEQIIQRDKIVIEFSDDSAIYDADSINCDYITMCEVKPSFGITPAYFYHKPGDTFRFYNKKEATKKEDWFSTRYTLNGKPIFEKCKHYTRCLGSIYNCIYTYKGTPVFSMMKSNESTERYNFSVAYNPIYLNEKETAFIVKSILRISFSDIEKTPAT